MNLLGRGSGTVFGPVVGPRRSSWDRAETYLAQLGAWVTVVPGEFIFRGFWAWAGLPGEGGWWASLARVIEERPL